MPFIITGFGFPASAVLPSHIVGAVSLVVLAVVLVAQIRRLAVSADSGMRTAPHAR